MRMDQPLPLATEQLFFIRQQTGSFDLLSLEPQHIFTPCTICGITLQSIQLCA
jgi:hypothetical protein